MTVEPDELRIAVRDDGAGIPRRLDRPGAGLGLPIIATLADRFEVQHLDAGTRPLHGFRRAAAPPRRRAAAGAAS